MNRVTSAWTAHRGFKLVSLVLAVVIWVILIGKKDSVLVRDLNVVFLTEKGLSVVKSSSSRLQVKLKGPRVSLLKMRSISEPYSVDVKQLEKGVHQVQVPGDGLDLPVGVSISEISPNQLWIKVENPVLDKETVQ